MPRLPNAPTEEQWEEWKPRIESLYLRETKTAQDSNTCKHCKIRKQNECAHAPTGYTKKEICEYIYNFYNASINEAQLEYRLKKWSFSKNLNKRAYRQIFDSKMSKIEQCSGQETICLLNGVRQSEKKIKRGYKRYGFKAQFGGEESLLALAANTGNSRELIIRTTAPDHPALGPAVLRPHVAVKLKDLPSKKAEAMVISILRQMVSEASPSATHFMEELAIISNPRHGSEISEFLLDEIQEFSVSQDKSMKLIALDAIQSDNDSETFGAANIRQMALRRAAEIKNVSANNITAIGQLIGYIIYSISNNLLESKDIEVLLDLMNIYNIDGILANILTLKTDAVKEVSRNLFNTALLNDKSYFITFSIKHNLLPTKDIIRETILRGNLESFRSVISHLDSLGWAVEVLLERPWRTHIPERLRLMVQSPSLNKRELPSFLVGNGEKPLHKAAKLLAYALNDEACGEIAQYWQSNQTVGLEDNHILHAAVQYSRENAVRELLHRGADVNAGLAWEGDRYLSSPLERAFRASRSIMESLGKYLAVVDILLKAGADLLAEVSPNPYSELRVYEYHCYGYPTGNIWEKIIQQLESSGPHTILDQVILFCEPCFVDLALRLLPALTNPAKALKSSALSNYEEVFELVANKTGYSMETIGNVTDIFDALGINDMYQGRTIIELSMHKYDNITEAAVFAVLKGVAGCSAKAFFHSLQQNLPADKYRILLQHTLNLTMHILTYHKTPTPSLSVEAIRLLLSLTTQASISVPSSVAQALGTDLFKNAILDLKYRDDAHDVSHLLLTSLDIQTDRGIVCAHLSDALARNVEILEILGDQSVFSDWNIEDITSVTELLIDIGWDMTISAVDGFRIAHLVANIPNSTPLLQRLRCLGAYTASDDTGIRILRLVSAIASGDYDMVEQLLRFSTALIIDRCVSSCRVRKRVSSDYMFDYDAHCFVVISPLILAIQHGDVAIVQLLIESGADVNLRVDISIGGEEDQIWQYSNSHSYQILKHAKQISPFECAVLWRRLDTIFLLLKAGVDDESVDNAINLMRPADAGYYGIIEIIDNYKTQEGSLSVVQD